VTKDGRTAFVVAQLKPENVGGEAPTRFNESFAAQKDVRLGGLVMSYDAVNETIEADLRRAELIAFPLLFLLSLIVFRSLIAALLPVLIGGLTIPIAFAVLGAFNEVTEISVFALNLMTGLGLGLAIDYSLLLVTRFREELDNGAETAEAVRTTVGTAGRTIVFSAITVTGSLAVLTIFPLGFLYSMGIAGASVAVVAATVALIVVPALLALLGPRINSLSLARKPLDHSTERWRRLAQFVMSRPARIAIVTSMVLLVAGLPALRLQFTDVDVRVLPVESAPHQVDLAMDQLPQGSIVPSVVAIASAEKSQAKQVAALARDIKRVDNVERVAPPVYLGDATWRIEAFDAEPAFSASAIRIVDDVRATAAGWKTGEAVLVGGSTAAFLDQRDAIIERVPLAILLVGMITFVVLFLMTGSVVLPIKTFVMNLLTLSATFGLLVLIFQDGRFQSLLDYRSQGALELTQPVLLFVTAFALATDYGVFLLGRIKELHDAGLDEHDSVVEGVARTGRVITAAAILFCVAIGAFATSQIVFIKLLGLGTALAVIIDATIVRALLVPSLMALLGKWNWWAPKPLARLHERFGISEGPGPAEPANA
jgi:RND superfamily putative drug exporter